MKFRVIVADPCWRFSDSLTMSSVKRGASSQYKTLTNSEIVELDVESLAAKDAVLALWVPSSLLDVGMLTMHAWGFEMKQTHIWVKTKKKPLDSFHKTLKKNSKLKGDESSLHLESDLYYLNDSLSFGMGRLFRQTHEICLIGTRGKIYNHLRNKSQRSVHFAPNLKHSEKPENLQNMLDVMFNGKKLELFARRDRPGYTCVGLECPSTLGEDIRDSIKRLNGSSIL